MAHNEYPILSQSYIVLGVILIIFLSGFNGGTPRIVGSLALSAPTEGLTETERENLNPGWTNTSRGFNLDEIEEVDEDDLLHEEASNLEEQIRLASEDNTLLGPEDAPRGGQSTLAWMKELVGRKMAPVTAYTELISRYMTWVREYNEFKVNFEQVNPGHKIVTASVLMKNEYGRLDKKLMEEACGEDDSENNERQAEIENMDFVLKVLSELIEELDDILKKLQTSDRSLEAMSELNLLELGSTSDQGTGTDLEDGETVTAVGTSSDQSVALARARRIALSATRGVLKKESFCMIKIVVLNALVENLINLRHKGTAKQMEVLALLEPIILLLATPNASYVMSYIQDIQFRAALLIVKKSINRIRECPLPRFLSRRRSHARSDIE